MVGQLASLSPTELTTTCKMCHANSHSDSLELPLNQPISAVKIHVLEVSGTGLFPVSLSIMLKADADILPTPQNFQWLEKCH